MTGSGSVPPDGASGEPVRRDLDARVAVDLDLEPGGRRATLSGPDDAWHAGMVRGPVRIALLCVLCLGVLVTTDLAVLGVLAAAHPLDLSTSTGAPVWLSQLQAGLYLVGVGAVVAVVPIACVGWPAGLLLSWLLRRRRREAEHVLWFAGVGAVLAPACLLPYFGVGDGARAGWAVLLYAAVHGAIGAGGGRLLAGVVVRRRLRRVLVAPGAPPPYDARWVQSTWPER